MENQAKPRSFRLTPKYKSGFMVPRNYEHAKQLDKVNKNTKWQDSTNLEISQLDKYDTLIDHGVVKSAPQGYKRIRPILFMTQNMMVGTKHVVSQMVT